LLIFDAILSKSELSASWRFLCVEILVEIHECHIGLCLKANLRPVKYAEEEKEQVTLRLRRRWRNKNDDLH
jgi:hypothetical protein